MRTEQEIKDRLQPLLEDYAECKNWYENAYERYSKDKKFWGEASPEEYLDASNQLALLSAQVDQLKWVLNETA